MLCNGSAIIVIITTFIDMDLISLYSWKH